MKKEIIEIIDCTIKTIWEYDIKRDYNERWLLKEDTLKNTFYYYLRTKLDGLFREYNIRVFTEFTDSVFAGAGLRPDIVIAEMNFKKSSKYYGDDVKELLCVMELKYKNGFSSSKDIAKDYDKLQKYVKDLNVDCKLYMATIWEYEDDETSWVRKNAAWAKGRLTELNASYERETGDMRFYIYQH
ncbi:MAG: hypothetical protein E7578_04145 [Ruminococcaceae bacterium]|nr:hypothetical protein [Oscillospiraceae bacterium]